MQQLPLNKELRNILVSVKTVERYRNDCCLNVAENNHAHWSLYVPPGSTFRNSSFSPHSVFMCFVWISEQTAIISLYNINWLVFITETESVYCAVRTGSLNTG